jgi:glutamate racemase
LRRPVAFLDSGIGGLPYLEAVRRLLPRERYVYVADSARFPYGPRDPVEITRFALDLAARLIERENPRLVVVACNTMSVVALSALRSRYPIPFVGTVPAVKPAAAVSPGGRIAVLATRKTAEGEYLKGLIESHAEGCSVACIPAGDLVDFVERELWSATPGERAARTRLEADKLLAAGVDTVVLACTHFLHLEREFREALGTAVRVVDSRDGVARRTVRLLEAGGPGPDSDPGPGSLFITGGGPVPERYRYFADRFGLIPAGSL